MSQTNAAPKVPTHLGIIPDGNRRWAEARGLKSFDGHARGVQVLREVGTAGLELGIDYVTVYAFSTENWRRASDEVGYLMDLFYRIVTRDIDELHEKGIRLRILGSREGLSSKLTKAFEKAEAKTADNPNGTISLALNYGGEQEIVDAVKALNSGGLDPNEITPEHIAAHLYGPDIPPLDLIIRTSGEHRTSGFMLWRAAYAEFYFVEKHWPDFTPSDLHAALEDYAGRVRRFGA